ncbi:hypothetical protein ABZ446_18100 [Streptomyces sp. NPDC005813]|uniref:hypothetical protein n=1 Tax=Streptomyces sp. NPDC005813 TaxID=3155592 RepID=UPI0033EAC54E
MTEPPDRSELAHRTAAFCALLGSSGDVRRLPEVRAAAERALALLRSGADTAALAAGYDDMDHALRRSGHAGGLTGGSRGATAPGVAAHIKVAVCPSSAPCTRLERARDLLPAPPCAVHGARMRKARLEPER